MLSVLAKVASYPDVAARLVHRVVDEGEMAMRKRRQSIRTQRLDRHDPRGERVVDRRHVLLGRRENDRDRLQLDDRHYPRGVARVDDVAGIDQTEAGLPHQGRADRRVVFQLGLGVVDRGLIPLDLRGELIDHRLLRVELLARRGVLFLEESIALQVVLRVLQRRFVLGLLPERLIEGRLVGPRIDLGENITHLHHLALFEINLGDLAVDPAAHRDRVVRLDDAEAAEIDGEIGLSVIGATVTGIGAGGAL